MLSCHFSGVRQPCVTVVRGAAPGIDLPAAFICCSTSGGNCIFIVETTVFCHRPILTGGADWA
jgi:hypothetical protein